MVRKASISLPPVPASLADKQLRELLAAIRKIIELREGIGHDNSLETLVTHRDLQEYVGGVAFDIVPQQAYNPNDGTVPDPPTDLVVALVGAMRHRITFNWPATGRMLDVVEVWRSVNNQSRSSAFLIGRVSWPENEIEFLGITPGDDYYYWIRCRRGSSYSTWEPPDIQGGYLLPASEMATIGDLIAQLMDDDNYRTQFKVRADAFKFILPADDVPYWETGIAYERYAVVMHTLPGPGITYYQSLFDNNTDQPPSDKWMEFDSSALDQANTVVVIGQVDGVPMLGLRGDAVIDGSIMTRALAAESVTADKMSAHDVFAWTLQSGNYSPGTSGFKIDCDPLSPTYGRAEFNDFVMVINYSTDITGTPQSLADISVDEWDLLNGMQGWAAGNFVDLVTYAADIALLQDQIDGAVDTWFYSGIPGPTVLPESGWLSPDTRAEHVGDLYFDEASGLAYRYLFSDPDYFWQQTNDLTAQALATAQGAYDLADGKRRVFVVQPAPPYDAGDLWIDKTSTPFEISSCVVGRETGSFNAADWGLVARNVSGTADLTDDAGLGNTADWQQVSGVPYATIFNNDDSVAFGFNPTFSDWPGALPAGWSLGYGAAPTKETTIRRVGQYAVKFVATGVSQYIYASSYFGQTPLPVGAFISGTYDIYIASGFVGTPGLWIGIWTSADYSTSTHHRLPATAVTGSWQRVSFTVRPPAGGRIYGIRLYLMPSWNSSPLTLGTGTVYYDNLRFAVMDNSMDNTAITISPDGALAGAGGGQVTISGMGYVGDLDATNGAPAGTLVGGVDAEIVVSNASSGAEAYTGTEAYRNDSAPTNNGAFGTITSGTATADGNVVVTVNYTYSQGEVPADQLFVFVKQGGGTVTSASPCFATNAVSGSMAFTLIPSTTYSFGIQAVRRTESGLVGTAIATSANVPTIAGDYTGNIAGSAAATVAENAAQAITATNNMAADGYLSAQEKAIWRVQWPGMQASYNQTIGQATSYGIQALSQFTGLTTARNNLYTYLATTLQTWSDPSNADVISPSTQLTTYVQAFYDKLQIAANKIADYAHTAHGVDDNADNTYSALGGIDPALVGAWANDPAARINAKTTVISGGKIETGTVIAGGLAANITLTNYLYLGNTMQIDTTNPVYLGKYGGNNGLFLDGTNYKTGFFRDSVGVYHFRVNGSPAGPGPYASGRGMSFSSAGDFQVFGDIVATGNVKARNINTLVTATATASALRTATATATTANLTSDATNGAGVILSGNVRVACNFAIGGTVIYSLYRGTTLLDSRTLQIETPEEGNTSVIFPVYFHSAYTGTSTYKLTATAIMMSAGVSVTVVAYVVATAPLR